MNLSQLQLDASSARHACELLCLTSTGLPRGMAWLMAERDHLIPCRQGWLYASCANCFLLSPSALAALVQVPLSFHYNRLLIDPANKYDLCTALNTIEQRYQVQVRISLCGCGRGAPWGRMLHCIQTFAQQGAVMAWPRPHGSHTTI